VFSVERVPELAARARELLAGLGYHNIELFTGDGSVGLPDLSPFDAIVVTAAAPQAPRPLLAQLAEGGRLVVRSGDRPRAEADARRAPRRRLDEVVEVDCRFVPLVGAEGFGEGVEKQ